MYKVKDIKLSDSGRKQLEWAEKHMPVLMSIRQRFRSELPLRGTRISAVLHVTKETGALMLTLKAGGAEVKLAGSNPLSTQDDVAAFLASEGIGVFAWRGESLEDYYQNMVEITRDGADLIMDDGADLHSFMHEKSSEGGEVLGGTEETTTGVNRLKVMEEEGVLRYPIIAVNNAFTKYLFDNRIGTGQSTVDGILRATNVLLAGKTVVVAGYGWVGRGIATRMRGMGAKVIVTEVDPVRALEATMDGFDVMPMSKAARLGDLFVTATGNKGVIREEHLKNMKDGALLANSGHFDVEIDVAALRRIATKRETLRIGLEKYVLQDGKTLYLLAEGRLVNLGAAEGHPSEVMDMSFANQALAVEYLVKNKGKLEKKVYNVPPNIDNFVAATKLKTMGVEIDEMTMEQREYVKQWRYGT
ncbi:S-adenosyl-L-homocysteine hydrolase [Sulfodiicoccus acidiphilus]|uniref:Adenosylhomocysteinase n=1 Tax=Sulfodiicoccus acidiphilus TaxID=1670455 RepID=A0A348B6Y8_9CREN|nr:adenosylhomocysteinase [Sulfodiicoccus acidiphilus]BBD73940.1 S-adenosyl-L-homocysteine hydrolase [Sulfodiicoccus acidiphilus]GGU05364.1 S-adenosyl-L-homocysteine hydrolase [Sulfodiicoccus acidiphilus]